MPSVNLIRNYGLYFELNLLGFEGNNVLSVLEKNHRSLEGLEMKNEVERFEIFNLGRRACKSTTKVFLSFCL